MLFSGIVISLSVAAMLVSGHMNLNCFYDVGEIYDIPRSGQVSTENVTYLTKEDLCVADTDHAARRFTVEDKGIAWKYLYLEAELDGKASIPVTIELKNQKQKTVACLDREIKEGNNIISLEGQQFYLGYIWLENQKGQKFLFNNIHLFEREPVFFLQDGMKYAVGIFALYLVVVGLWGTYGRWHLPERLGLTRRLQKGYCCIGNFFWKFKPDSGKVQDRVRTGLFFGLLIYTVVIYRLDVYYTHYPYHMLIGTVFIFLLGIFSIEKKLEMVHWDTPLVRYWLMFWIVTVISDILVKKRVMGYVGVVMILVMGFTCFVWNNMECPERIIKNLLDAIELAFWLNVPVCLLFFPFVEGTRYTGPMRNAALYGMYMVVAVVMFAAKVEEEWKKGDISTKFSRYVAGLAVAFYMLWKTQSATDVGVVGILACLYGIRIYLLRENEYRKKREKKAGKGTMYAIVFLAGSFLLIYVMASWGFSNVSRLFEKADVGIVEVEYEPPEIEEYIEGGSRLANKLHQLRDIESVMSGRNLYWMEYLRGMNLWGHEYKAYFSGHSRWAHNQILWIAYYYGVMSIVPYLMLLIEGVREAARGVCLERGNYRIVPIGMILGLLIISMVDNVEQPFGMIVWYLLYMMLGFLFTKET